MTFLFSFRTAKPNGRFALGLWKVCYKTRNWNSRDDVTVCEDTTTKMGIANRKWESQTEIKYRAVQVLNVIGLMLSIMATILSCYTLWKKPNNNNTNKIIKIIKKPKMVGLVIFFVFSFNLINVLLFFFIVREIKSSEGWAYILCWVVTVFSFLTGLSSMAIKS